MKFGMTFNLELPTKNWISKIFVSLVCVSWGIASKTFHSASKVMLVASKPVQKERDRKE